MVGVIQAGTKALRKTRRGDPFSEKVKQVIWDRDKGICVYCHGKGYEVDHVVPRSKGGPSVQSNGVVTCTVCNAKKSNDISFDWLFVAFFHLLDLGESLNWLDSLWEEKVQQVRGRVQALPSEPKVLQNVMPSSRVENTEVTDEICIECQRPFQTTNELRRWCSTGCARDWGRKQEPKDERAFLAYVDKLCEE